MLARARSTLLWLNRSPARCRARQVVRTDRRGGPHGYGVNTGFGKLSDVHIDPSQLRDLQLNLVRSHAVGLGSPLNSGSESAGLLRANCLRARLQLAAARC